MLAFVIPKGTPAMAVKVVKKGENNFEYKKKQILTKRENCFIREDVIVEPNSNGKLNSTSKEDSGIVVLSILMNRPYAFREIDWDIGKRSDWALLVEEKYITIG
jgi:hypothetical protein